MTHPYFPKELVLSGYAAPELPFQQVLAYFFAACAVLFAVTWALTSEARAFGVGSIPLKTTIKFVVMTTVNNVRAEVKSDTMDADGVTLVSQHMHAYFSKSNLLPEGSCPPPQARTACGLCDFERAWVLRFRSLPEAAIG